MVEVNSSVLNVVSGDIAAFSLQMEVLREDMRIFGKRITKQLLWQTRKTLVSINDDMEVIPLQRVIPKEVKKYI